MRRGDAWPNGNGHGDCDLRKAAIRAEGDLDVRGLLGMPDEVPVGLQISGFILRWSLTRRQAVTVLIRLTEEYCVVSRTLNPRAEVTFKLTGVIIQRDNDPSAGTVRSDTHNK